MPRTEQPAEIKPFSTKWVQSQADALRVAMPGIRNANSRDIVEGVAGNLDEMVDHLSKNAGKKGCGTSARKKVTSAENGRKGGRPKGSRNKPK